MYFYLVIFSVSCVQKKITPATPGNFRKHENRVHAEKKKCQWPGCIYVRPFTDYTSDTFLFLQATAEDCDMKRHLLQHENPDLVNCPCCGSSTVR